VGLLIGHPLRAENVIYAKGHSQVLNISSSSHTLLAFEAPIIASVCHPADILNLELLKKSEFSLPANYQKPEKAQGKDHKKRALAFFLKLVPKKSLGTSICSFKLSDGEIFSAQFRLQSSINRPYVAFKRKKAARYDEQKRSSRDLAARRMFKALISKGRVGGFKNITPIFRAGTKPYTIYSKSKKSRYEFLYLGQGAGFKAIILKGYAREPFTTKPLKTSGVGEIYFSSYLKDPKRYKQQNTYQRKEDFYLYILASEQMSETRLKEILL